MQCPTTSETCKAYEYFTGQKKCEHWFGSVMATGTANADYACWLKDTSNGASTCAVHTDVETQLSAINLGAQDFQIAFKLKTTSASGWLFKKANLSAGDKTAPLWNAAGSKALELVNGKLGF